MGATMDLDVGMLLQNSRSEVPCPAMTASSSKDESGSDVPSGSARRPFRRPRHSMVRAARPRAIGASRRNFGERCGERHHDSRPESYGVPRGKRPLRNDCRPMRRSTPRARSSWLRVSSVFSAPRSFESAGALLIIELEEDRIVGKPGKCLEWCRRDANVRPEFC